MSLSMCGEDELLAAFKMRPSSLDEESTTTTTTTTSQQDEDSQPLHKYSDDEERSEELRCRGGSSPALRKVLTPREVEEGDGEGEGERDRSTSLTATPVFGRLTWSREIVKTAQDKI